MTILCYKNSVAILFFAVMKQAEINKSKPIMLRGKSTQPIIDGCLWARNTSD